MQCAKFFIKVNVLSEDNLETGFKYVYMTLGEQIFHFAVTHGGVRIGETSYHP